jgi:hypothetical protein
MINITIQTDVPKFFRNLHIQAIKEQFKLGSIEDFLKSKCSEDFYKEYQWLIEKSIEFRKSTGVYHIPITQTICNNRFTLICENHADSFMPNINATLDFSENSYIINRVRLDEVYKSSGGINNHLNLIDGSYYEGYSTTKLSRTTVEKYDSIYSKFIELNKLQPFINWFDKGSILEEYFNQLNNIENSVELELYNRWLKHNIQIANS